MISRIEGFVDWYRERRQGKNDKGVQPAPVLPKLTADKCKGCGLCVQACPCPIQILKLTEGKLVIEDNDMCSQCGHCVAVCPTGALSDRFAAEGDAPKYDRRSLPSERQVEAFFRSRRSVRHYRDEPVSRDKLQKIIDAGKYAPTAGNRQEVYFVVIDDPEEIEKLREMVFTSVYQMFLKLKNRAVYTLATLMMGKVNVDTVLNYIPILDAFRRRWEEYGEDRLFYHAPAVMLVHGSKWDDTIEFSCAAVLYQSSLMAHSLGVGCCFNGFLQVAINKDAKVRKWLNIPRGHKCYGAMGLGYPKMKYLRFVRRNPLKVKWR